MHAALSDVEVLLNKLLIVAVLLMPLAVECFWLAATPSYREFWESKKADAAFVITGGEDPSASTDVWVCWQKSGFSVFTHGKESLFKGEVPRLDCTAPLSESVFALLQDEIRTIAEIAMVTFRDKKFWEDYYFVWDSYYSRRFQREVCAPEVVSLMETGLSHHDGQYHYWVWILGRNFIWQESTRVEVELEDLFMESPEREWFKVLANVVKTDLRHMSTLSNILPIEKFDQFLITEEGLKILFQPYELTGFPPDSFAEVVVSWDLLRPFLKPGAPVTIWYEKQLQKR